MAEVNLNPLATLKPASWGWGTAGAPKYGARGHSPSEAASAQRDRGFKKLPATQPSPRGSCSVEGLPSTSTLDPRPSC